MRHFISRWFAKVRVARTPAPAPVAPPAAAPAVVLAEPIVQEPAACGVYLWATAHGIDIKPGSRLRSCDCCAQEHEVVPEAGTFVMDKVEGKVGQVVGRDGSWLRLRSLVRGKEWEAHRDAVRTATDAELLSAKVQAFNSAGRWGR
ncbi:hypothetical protein [Streptomyces sp. NPDC002537]